MLLMLNNWGVIDTENVYRIKLQHKSYNDNVHCRNQSLKIPIEDNYLWFTVLIHLWPCLLSTTHFTTTHTKVAIKSNIGKTQFPLDFLYTDDPCHKPNGFVTGSVCIQDLYSSMRADPKKEF